jgi:cytochrome c oxidase subunit IV
MEHLVQHMMYIHLLEQGLLQWEPLVLLIFLLSVAGLPVARVVALVVERVVIFTQRRST